MGLPGGAQGDVAGAAAQREAAGRGDLGALLRFQQAACASIGSDLYARLIGRTLARIDRAGPLRDLLAPHADDPFGSALALRYLGAVHRIVLEGRAPALAAHYPSTGGSPRPELEDVFEATVCEHLDELAERVDDGVQTNEVGRSASMVGALLEVAALGMPLRLLELGASAGLNLRWDHYRYEAGGWSFGPAGSPVRFVEPWTNGAPHFDRWSAQVVVAERRGCDRSPIDATSADGRVTLRSYVWPDLVARFARLDAAISVAAQVAARIDEADAAEWAADMLAEPIPGVATVVMHSIMIQYMSPEGRSRLVGEIAAAGRRAGAAAPLAWVRLEPGADGAELRCTLWPGGRDRRLAVSSYHGPPVRWLA